MRRFRICQDLEEGRRLWLSHWPCQTIFDFWDVRRAFQDGFQRPPCFIVAEENNRFQGLLALSWIEEEQAYGHFPGETWQGKTWLEQNRIIAKDATTFQGLLNRIPAKAGIRYLTGESTIFDTDFSEMDETGYLLFPGEFGYSFDAYLQRFSGKSRKKILRETTSFEKFGISFRHNHIGDIEKMFEMNIEGFGHRSYFSDYRFLRSFENLVSTLNKMDLLRITSVLIGGQLAAVDVGALWGSSYTVLAGGTRSDFPGVAKLINIHHIEWSCRQKLSLVDFLCGDFGWKKRFHLEPRHLYALNRPGYEPVPEVASGYFLQPAYA